MSNPLFSVLLANYNNGQYIEETLESIYKQTYTDWEIIIVDDGSTDNSFSIYEKLQDNPKIRIVYNEENKGVGYTKRRCIEEVKGDICGFLDPEDTLREDSLRLMVDAHNRYPNASIVYSRFYYCDENLKITHAPKYQAQCIQGDPFYFNLDYYIGPFATFKKEKYNKTEGINIVYPTAEDQDWYIKLYEVGDCILLEERLYYYRIHRGGVSSMGDKVMISKYWHWRVIESAIERRKLDVKIEEVFITMFAEKKEYDLLQKRYKSVRKFKEIGRIVDQIKQLFKGSKSE